MLTITRLQANRLRTVFSRAVGRSFRSAPVLFRSDENGLTVGIQGGNVAVECQIAGHQPVESFAVSLALLKKCEGSKSDPVTLQRRGKDVEARWEDAGVPQAMACDASEPFELPPLPGKMEPNDPWLITALRDAADSTDDQSTRYALGCMQLRPESGRIAASDASRLLVQQGFRFPWNGEVLIPGNSVFACRDLHGEPVAIGRSENWVTVRAGVWTIHLWIEKDARFPNVDSIIPDAASAESVLHLSDEDCHFLLSALPKLPGQADPNSPVTCDFNGQALIRGKAVDQPQATELLLSNSRLEGKPLAFLATASCWATPCGWASARCTPSPRTGRCFARTSTGNSSGRCSARRERRRPTSSASASHRPCRIRRRNRLPSQRSPASTRGLKPCRRPEPRLNLNRPTPKTERPGTATPEMATPGVTTPKTATSRTAPP